MCGIAGFLAPSLHPDAMPGVVTSMLSLIRHRGPDETGYYLDDGFAMGTVRLAIVDLASGSQPMSDPTGRHWISFNGELYNHVELREELRALGRPFRTHCDTEVVLQAWLQWGAGCLTRFNGAFAFAIRDAVSGELVLARDRYGKRPLFYTEHDGGLLFASEMKAFRAFPGFRFTLDPRELASVFAVWTPLPDRTPFEGVRQLPMGGVLTVRDGRRTLRTYEELAVDAPPFEGSEEDAAAFVRETLRASVELRLRSDVEVGVYLSGGLDSSVVTKLATDLSRGEVRTFSVAFENAEFDESGSQRVVASHLGTRHSSVTVSGADIAEHFPAAVHHAEVPSFRTAFVPMYLLSRHVRDSGVKTVLSGEGADEAFLGYSLFRETMLRASWHELSGEERKAGLARLHPELAHFGPAHQKHMAGLFQQFSEERLPGLFSHELRYQNGRFAARLLKDRGVDPFADALEMVRAAPGYAGLSAVQKAQWLEYKTLLAGYLLSTQGERMGLAHGVENRCPFLDPAVVRAAASVNLRFDDGSEEKAILKKAFRGELPASSLARRKQPYRAPGSAVFKDHRPDYLELVLSGTELGKLDWVDPVFAQKLVAKVMTTPADEISTKEDQAFVYLLSTAVLDRRFVRDTGWPDAVPEADLKIRTVVDNRRALPRVGGMR
ncbi:asparagine synthase [Streptomyces eurocidicus]|uniref:asparagine synthase (glutamine-hydrolyzing) n=1 Tax=Streptomyces eurocidicus TaxID=66423 RepID=A0A2N8NT51_STREU|nr:asparagine synthase (glutamine-hydrolyzing) [Streptomyces eurocidicus]MBB5119236.1 asparagine synthase (glutamine-hydrolyzing) [Streptomyces eurocidicus]MBF6053176.1 asparagine synthase (glutamine-hydrolyzing) [Streptomyces eurocidicus]PNE31950.1 asparagine synthase [Streptomyces eurocidicus]